MKRLKTFIIVLSFLFVAESFIGYSLHTWYVDYVLKKEINLRIKDKSAQSLSAFWLSVNDINLLVDDWAEWDTMAKAIQNWTPLFEKENFQHSLLKENSIDCLLVYNENFKEIFSLKNEKFQNQLDILSLNSRINNLISKHKKLVQSIIWESGMNMYVYAEPIEYQNNFEDIKGYLIAVREIGPVTKDFMSQILQEERVDLIPLKEFHKHKIFDALSSGKVYWEDDTKNKFTKVVYSLIPGDKDGEGLVIKVKFDFPMSKYMENLNIYFLMLALLSFIVVILMFSSVYRKYKKRLNTLLKVSGKLSRKIIGEHKTTNNFDEIKALEEILNSLFLSIDKLENERKESSNREMIRERVFAVGRIAAELSHEINTPIRIIKNCMPIIDKKVRLANLDDNDMKMFDMVENEIDRIDNITQNLLMFLKRDSGKMERINISEILNEMKKRYLTGAKSCIDVDLKIKEPIFCFGVEGQLAQVFLNILKNAEEAEATLIEVVSIFVNEFCILYFKDNGKGISSNIKNSLFEPFVSSKKKRGLGLGLNISYNIILNHGGEIYLENFDDCSTCFAIKIPYLQEKEGSAV